MTSDRRLLPDLNRVSNTDWAPVAPALYTSYFAIRPSPRQTRLMLAWWLGRTLGREAAVDNRRVGQRLEGIPGFGIAWGAETRSGEAPGLMRRR